MAINSKVYTRHGVTMSWVLKAKLHFLASVENDSFNDAVVKPLIEKVKAYEAEHGLIPIELKEGQEMDEIWGDYVSSSPHKIKDQKKD